MKILFLLLLPISLFAQQLGGTTNKWNIPTVQGNMTVTGNFTANGRTSTKQNAYLGRINVCDSCTQKTIEQVVDSLSITMTLPCEIFLGNGNHYVSDSIVIDLPYNLSIRGEAFDLCNVIVKPSLMQNKTMFKIYSQTNFERITFTDSASTSWGDVNGEDFIEMTNATYVEVKDFQMTGGHNSINLRGKDEIFVFDAIFTDTQGSSIIINSTDTTNIDIEIANFINCQKGIRLMAGVFNQFLINACKFTQCDTAIYYQPTTYTLDTNGTYITNNYWDNNGKFVVGFDFTRTDSRDANVIIDYNSGYESKGAHAKINVINNTTPVTVVGAGTYYKANFTTTSSYTCKFTLNNNRMTYQSDYGGDLVFILAGNIQVNQNSRTVDVAIVKNATTPVISTMSARLQSQNVPYSWSSVVYASDAKQGDFYEIWVTSANAGDQVIIQDLQWFVYAR